MVVVNWAGKDQKEKEGGGGGGLSAIFGNTFCSYIYIYICVCVCVSPQGHDTAWSNRCVSTFWRNMETARNSETVEPS